MKPEDIKCLHSTIYYADREQTNMAKKNYVIDTSVFLTDASSIFKFDNHDIFIPLKVLEEVDNHKKRQDSVGANARRIIRTLDELRTVGDLQKGVRLGRRSC